MFAAHHLAVTELLRERGLIDGERLDAALSEHEATGKSVAELVVNQGAVTLPALLWSVATHLQCEFA